MPYTNYFKHPLRLSHAPQAWYPVLQLYSDLHEMESFDFKSSEERNKIRLILNKITKGVDKPIVSESIRFPEEGIYAYIYSSTFVDCFAALYMALDFKTPLITREHSNDTQELLDFNKNMQLFHKTLANLKLHLSSRNDIFLRQSFECYYIWNKPTINKT